jgi:hypothetical protein
MIKQKNYPKIMFLIIAVASLLILFSIVNIIDTKSNSRIETSKKTLTGFAIENNSNDMSNQTNLTGSAGKMYTARSYAMYYVLIIGIIAGLFITFSVLKSTILKNIEIEEKERKM